jgi:hypothetical protein
MHHHWKPFRDRSRYRKYNYVRLKARRYGHWILRITDNITDAYVLLIDPR